MALGVGDVLRTTCNFSLINGVQYQNVYHHIFDGIGGVSDAAVVADIKTWAESMYATLAGHVLIGTVEQLSSVDQVEWVVDQWKVVANIGTFTPVFTPTGTGGQCPNQVSAFVVLKTARPKTVGRKFTFPTLEGDQNLGIIDAPTIAALVSYASYVINDITIDVANVLHAGVPRTSVNNFELFYVGVVTDLLGTQRRRRPGYGA